MRTRTWIFLFSGIVLLCAIALLLLRSGSGGAAAELWVDGELYQTVDLTVDQTIVIETAHGTNAVAVRGGEITVTSATCPDRICIAHGAARPGDPIVCLPNRLVVKLTDSGGVDAAVG